MATTQPAGSPGSGNPQFRVGFPAPAAAGDAALVRHITAMVNAVYAEDERGIWDPSVEFVRTSEDEVADYLRAGELLLAWRAAGGEEEEEEEHDSGGGGGGGGGGAAPGPTPEAARVIGCMRVQRTADGRTCQISMLAADQRFRGVGVGRELVRFAEGHAARAGAAVVEMDLLVPEHFVHPSKVRLEAWYTRMGYHMVRAGDFAAEHPRLAPTLAGPTTFKVLEKPLR